MKPSASATARAMVLFPAPAGPSMAITTRLRLRQQCPEVRLEVRVGDSGGLHSHDLDPVLRGEWLRDGALVCAAGANDPRKRELDNVVLERASFVCCDSKENARLESGDLIEPVDAGVLDWLEVHQLQDVVAGEVPGRESDADIVVFKSNGLAAWDVAIAAELLERARERGVGTTL